MTLHDELLDQLGEPGLEQVAGMLGTDTAKARDVVQAVTGLIVGGLARTARHPDAADALRGALEDHVDADPFNGDVASLIRDGHSILGHVLGGQGTEQAAVALARLTGIDTAAVMKLMPLIAPMVMFLLADRADRHDMDAGDVAADLDRERVAVPGGLAETLEELLAGIFGGAMPRPGGLYGGDVEPRLGRPHGALERRRVQGTSSPDW
ncbi:DUF937 domain-containing protein [Nonomuraea basaltis]|uniref:DUF937 domain-containing protein n=1 Tax=Nonomuraea basaltis TaxID=2495887 RepID=UPI001485C9AC|nr:DUF937 domain-containing protein [Nonomuraea basaltis]